MKVYQCLYFAAVNMQNTGWFVCISINNSLYCRASSKFHGKVTADRTCQLVPCRRTQGRQPTNLIYHTVSIKVYQCLCFAAVICKKMDGRQTITSKLNCCSNIKIRNWSTDWKCDNARIICTCLRTHTLYKQLRQTLNLFPQGEINRP